MTVGKQKRKKFLQKKNFINLLDTVYHHLFLLLIVIFHSTPFFLIPKVQEVSYTTKR